MTIYISPNPGKTSANEIALRAAQLLMNHGAAVLMCEQPRTSCSTAGVVYLPLEDLIDREKEIERLTKEQERLTKEIARCEGMLNNPNFVNKAPAAKVEAEKEKLEKYKEMKEKVNLQLTQMVK